jgi:hypothetical protein
MMSGTGEKERYREFCRQEPTDYLDVVPIEPISLKCNEERTRLDCPAVG